MRGIRLIVPDSAFKQAAADAWALLGERVPTHPLAFCDTVRIDKGTFRLHGIAVTELAPHDREVDAYIRLRDEFFLLPAERQVLTLLHETIHLTLWTGLCRDWYTRNEAIDLKYTVDHSEASETRHFVDAAALHVAIQLFHVKDEIAAEKYLQHHYASQRQDRASYYLDMRRANRAERFHLNLPIELHPFWFLLDVLRTGVACAISDELLIEEARELDSAARDDLRESSRPVLIDEVRALLDVEVEPLHVNFAAYERVFELALRARLPIIPDESA